MILLNVLRGGVSSFYSCRGGIAVVISETCPFYTIRSVLVLVAMIYSMHVPMVDTR